MYFFNFFIIYSTSILLPSVNTYVVLSANLNDFRSLAKKYVPKNNLVDQIKVMVLENDHKNNNRETLKVNNLDRTVEYLDEEEDDDYEVQRVSVLDSQDPSLIRPLAAPTVITVDDLVNELKHRILQENIDSGNHNAQVYTQVNDEPEDQLETVVYKSVQNKLKSPAPMKVFKDVQFGGIYEDTIDENIKPQIHYLGQIQIPAQYLKRKSVKDKTLTKKVITKKQRFVSPKHLGAGKKVGYVKQVLVPSKSNQKLTEYVLQPKLVQLVVQQPNSDQKTNLGQHSNTVEQSILEPQLSLMHQSSEMKLPLDQQPSIIQHLALMKQQIDRLNKIVEQNLAQNKISPTLENPQQNIDAGEAPFEIVVNSKEDAQNTSDSTEGEDQVAEDTLSEEATTEPIDSQASTEALIRPTTVENEQFIEDNEEVEESAGHEEEPTAGTVQNETITENEAHSTDVEETTSNVATTPAEAILVKADIIPRLDETPKTHTQEFGNPAAGEPIVEKTYNFNAPIAETKAAVNLKLPVDSARKVLLF